MTVLRTADGHNMYTVCVQHCLGSCMCNLKQLISCNSSPAGQPLLSDVNK